MTRSAIDAGSIDHRIWTRVGRDAVTTRHLDRRSLGARDLRFIAPVVAALEDSDATYRLLNFGNRHATPTRSPERRWLHGTHADALALEVLGGIGELEHEALH